MSVNEPADALADAPPKNNVNILAKAAADQEGEQSTVEVPVAPESSQSADYIPASKYKGVSWYKQGNKWLAKIYIDGKGVHLGLYDNEEDAARKYDEQAREKGKPINFASAGETQACKKRKSVEVEDKHPSNYTGVYWYKQGQKWMAAIKVDGKKRHLGYFLDEESAARKYDEEASRQNKPLNFPVDGQPQAQRDVSRSATSKYKGVSWDRAKLRWKAQITQDGKPSFLGHFESEEDAARKYDESATPLGKPVNFPAEGQLKAGAPKKRVKKPKQPKVEGEMAVINEAALAAAAEAAISAATADAVGVHSLTQTLEVIKPAELPPGTVGV